MGEKVRVSQHSGRAGYAKHNDRSFLSDMTDEKRRECVPHIREDGDVVALAGQQPGKNFEAAEMDFYRERYSAGIEKTNEAYRRSRHPERCKSVAQVYHGRLTRPEEIIIQIGDKNTDVPRDEFISAVNDYLDWLNAWNAEHGGHMQILNAACHFDETSPHCHIRRVWDYIDKDGHARLGQNKALELAGVDLPDTKKPAGRYNNRKMVFDAMARRKWQEIAKSRGFDVITEPRPSMRHKDKADFVKQQMAAEISVLEREIDAQKDIIRESVDYVDGLKGKVRNILGAKALPAADMDRLLGQLSFSGLIVLKSDELGSLMGQIDRTKEMLLEKELEIDNARAELSAAKEMAVQEKFLAAEESEKIVSQAKAQASEIIADAERIRKSQTEKIRAKDDSLLFAAEMVSGVVDASGNFFAEVCDALLSSCDYRLLGQLRDSYRGSSLESRYDGVLEEKLGIYGVPMDSLYPGRRFRR